MLYITTVIQPNNGAKTGRVMKRFFSCEMYFNILIKTVKLI